VIIAAQTLIDFSEASSLYRYQWRDLLGLIIGFVSTFIWGLEWGVVIAVSYSLIMMILYSIRPPIVQLGQVGDPEEFRYRPISESMSKYEGYVDRFLWHSRENSQNEKPSQLLPNGVIFRIDAPLYFVNCSYTIKRLLEYEKQVTERGEQCQWVIFDMNNVLDIDSTAIHALVQTAEGHKQNNIWFAITDMNDHVAKIVNASILIETVGQENVFPTIQDALQKRVELNQKDKLEKPAEHKSEVTPTPSRESQRQTEKDEGVELTTMPVSETEKSVQKDEEELHVVNETEKSEEKSESGDKSEKSEEPGDKIETPTSEEGINSPQND